MGHLRKCYVSATAKTDALPITFEIKRALADAPITFGQIHVFSASATTALCLIENDPKIIEEYKNFIEKMVPETTEARPNRRSGTGKTSAHLRALFVGNSLTIPVAESKLLLGPWQEILVFDFDDKIGRREILITVSGESAGGGKQA